MTTKTIFAGIAAAAMIVASGLASAQQPATPTPSQPLAPGALFDQVMSTMKCKEGQLCDVQTRSSRKRGVRPGGAEEEARHDLKTEGGRRSLEVAAKRGVTPTLDVEILFAYNSHVLTEESRKKLNEVGAAFRERALSGSSFAIVGHTDAAGSEGFNLSLSERRAAAVREYLVKNAAVQGDRLNSWGRGKTELKEPDNPLSPANRRVQLINSGSSVSASAAPAPTSGSSRPAAGSAGATQVKPLEECRRYSPVANKVIACSE